MLTTKFSSSEVRQNLSPVQGAVPPASPLSFYKDAETSSPFPVPRSFPRENPRREPTSECRSTYLKSSKQKLGFLKRWCKWLDRINICRLNKICTPQPPSVFSNSSKTWGLMRNLRIWKVLVEIKKPHLFVQLSVYDVCENSGLLHNIKIRSQIRIDCNKLFSVWLNRDRRKLNQETCLQNAWHYFRLLKVRTVLSYY